MPTRNDMLIALYREVIGPRNGPNEILPEEQDPRTEYITGVLEPVTASSTDERIEDNIDEIIEETSSEEDQDSQGYVASPGVFAPALDPKALPRSIGVSFTLESEDGIPQIEVCATWARYYLEQDGWHRTPAGYLSGNLDVSQASIDLTAGPGARLHIRSRQLIPGVWRVSVFLINITQIVGERPTTSEYLFQPQLRTHVLHGTRLVPVRHLDENHVQSQEQTSENQEEISLALLYRQRTAFARGHMCGAMWKDIDPERPFELTDRPQEAPFVWTDSDTIVESEREKFSPADVRSELIPIYLIQTPDMDWQDEYGRPPELRPEVLAETWDPDRVRSALQPLVEGYQAWLQVQQGELDRLEVVYQDVARTHLQECNQVVSRIQEAIEILCSDEDARLAFCFANKAIDMQARWKNPQKPLTWRPFQLAFILLNIPSLANPLHPDRDICDLLWFPTGGGKTEAYLGLSAFVLGLRRLRAKHNSPGQDRTGAGVGVLSRYTLRLLTIQQFRRALGVITACETLRMMGAGRGSIIGWRPQGCPKTDNLIWGGIRFSAGLWVGGGVTPNSMMSIGPMPVPGGTGFMMIAGALDILRGLRPDYDGPDVELARYVQQVRRNLQVEGEPAQVTNCPCCQAPLAISDEGLGAGQFTLHFVYQSGNPTIPPISMLTPRRPIPSLVINSVNIFSHQSPTYRTISINFTIPDGSYLSSLNVDDWWEQSIKPALGGNAQIQSARPSRPGYFILKYSTNQGTYKQNDFDIYCPNPNCELNQSLWAEQVPEPREREGSRTNVVRRQASTTPNSNRIPDPVIDLTDGLLWQDIPEPFRLEQGKKWSTRIPIPAFTVDDQIYHRCPSLVISTVDKFARLAFEPKAASLFGNVTHYHSRWGYYRIWCPPSDGSQQTNLRDHPAGRAIGNPLHREVQPFSPPELILQDELHLIEGPLGSMVGLFEMAVDMLSQRIIDERFVFPKYIASTATVRQAEAQVQSLFNRRLTQFPPSAVSADERFFATGTEAHPLDTRKPGRLYAAVCAPGKGAQTPIVRIWSSLLQGSFDLSQSTSVNAIDPFWTLVGYFNATRELAGALSLYRQDIPERMESRSGTGARVLDESRRLELSSRASSMNLPILLQKLEISMPNAQDAVFATSMFGTGVDVDRLSLMVVHGQPKTTSSYIQATGRVGRKTSALVVSFFRASRPRDLDHYEFFTGYHRALYRYVEPVTVAPFSPRARERSLGPLAVVLLRQAKALNGIRVHEQWRIQQRIGSTFHSLANRMASARFDPEVMLIPELFELRSASQPVGRRPVPGITNNETASELDRWRAIAALYPNPDQFVYNEPAVLRQPQRHVVLGDAQHRGRLEEAFENAPQSLRDVEETTGFKV